MGLRVVGLSALVLFGCGTDEAGRGAGGADAATSGDDAGFGEVSPTEPEPFVPEPATETADGGNEPPTPITPDPSPVAEGIPDASVVEPETLPEPESESEPEPIGREPEQSPDVAPIGDASVVADSGAPPMTWLDAGQTVTPEPEPTTEPESALDAGSGPRCVVGDPCRTERRCHLGTTACVGEQVSCVGTGVVESDCWEPISTVGAPVGRTGHASAWTGDRLIVWGGLAEDGVTATGGLYDPSSDTWEATEITGAGVAGVGIRDGWSAWLGGYLFVGGGLRGDGGPALITVVYDPISGAWSQGCDGPGFGRAVAYTDDEFIVWGGTASGTELDGFTCSAAAFPFEATAIVGGERRERHSAVWSGNELIVYGGVFDAESIDGGERYSFNDDEWTPIGREPAPIYSRWGHSAAWIDSRMLVWGGFTSEDESVPAAPTSPSGALYDPAEDDWSTMTTDSAPSPRAWTTGVVVGGRFFVWGGADGSGFAALGDGALYDPVTDTWATVSTESAPTARALQTVVSSGNTVIVWGGSDSTEPGGSLPNDGAIYYP